MLHDTDFCWKVQMKGVSLQFVPGALMHMRFRDNLKGIFRQAGGYAEYNVKIYKKYLSFGMPKLSRKQGVLSYMAFIVYAAKNIYRLRDKEGMAYWAWQLGWYMGRVKGSIKYKIFAL
jgi:cellulose synthase/poly-beta-1,6-N-acetylglucosamine synthase-like glycosyltransferase